MATAEIRPHATATISPAPLPSPTEPPSVEPTPSPTDGPPLDPTTTPSATPTEISEPLPTTDPSSTPLAEPTVLPTGVSTSDPSDAPVASSGTPLPDAQVMADSIPPELADFSAAQVTEYDVAWVDCVPLSDDSWTRDRSGRRALSHCLAAELAIGRRDPQLMAFLVWAARDEGTQDS